MLKQSFSRITKVLTVLLAVLFVATMTVGAASACSSERGSYHGADCDHDNYGCDGDHGNHGYSQGCDGDHKNHGCNGNHKNHGCNENHKNHGCNGNNGYGNDEDDC